MAYYIALAACVLLLKHAVFSFQRFTLSAARACEISPVSDAQTLMTPAWVGAVGWAASIAKWVTVVLLWRAFGWPYALGFVVLDFLIATTMPLLPFTRLYARLVLSELSRHLFSPAGQAAAALGHYVSQFDAAGK